VCAAIVSQLAFLLGGVLPHVPRSALFPRFKATTALLTSLLKAHADNALVVDSLLHCIGTVLLAVPTDAAAWDDETVRCSCDALVPMSAVLPSSTARGAACAWCGRSASQTRS
jgi:hypothetical protein